ncbi:hypothetical protein [uncultured Prevotella sp.]|uniref:hypothetical protein n=1 Tax=uncultured Prevotella sp. TaxID=159272 RepID=UPI00266CA1E4|nr:hypothetical protein [uncultured Prevotella sp.]
MSFNTEKIIVKNEDTGKDEDVKLFYSTITDNVGITCGDQEVFLTQDQFEALAYLMRRCFFTRDMLDKMQVAINRCECPYNVFSSHNESTWDLEVEKD